MFFSKMSKKWKLVLVNALLIFCITFISSFVFMGWEALLTSILAATAAGLLKALLEIKEEVQKEKDEECERKYATSSKEIKPKQKISKIQHYLIVLNKSFFY